MQLYAKVFKTVQNMQMIEVFKIRQKYAKACKSEQKWPKTSGGKKQKKNKVTQETASKELGKH